MLPVGQWWVTVPLNRWQPRWNRPGVHILIAAVKPRMLPVCTWTTMA